MEMNNTLRRQLKKAFKEANCLDSAEIVTLWAPKERRKPIFEASEHLVTITWVDSWKDARFLGLTHQEYAPLALYHFLTKQEIVPKPLLGPMHDVFTPCDMLDYFSSEDEKTVTAIKELVDKYPATAKALERGLDQLNAGK